MLPAYLLPCFRNNSLGRAWITRVAHRLCHYCFKCEKILNTALLYSNFRFLFPHFQLMILWQYHSTVRKCVATLMCMSLTMNLPIQDCSTCHRRHTEQYPIHLQPLTPPNNEAYIRPRQFGDRTGMAMGHLVCSECQNYFCPQRTDRSSGKGKTGMHHNQVQHLYKDSTGRHHNQVQQVYRESTESHHNQVQQEYKDSCKYYCCIINKN